MVATKLFALAILLGTAAAAYAQRPGDLMVTPTRLALDEKGRTGDITLLNRSSRTMRYRLTLVDMEMSEDGILTRVATGSGRSAASLLRLSPREIVLQPGVSQRIKIAVFFPAGQADGELRSHLAFEPIATPRPADTHEASSSTTLRLNFDLRSVVTIPVIVRHGKVAASTAITDPSVARSGKDWIAKFKLERSGTRSVRGDVSVVFTPAKGGSKMVLGTIEALPVYVPNSSRYVTLRLSRDPSTLGKGTIEFVFTEPDRSRGGAAARANLALQG